MSNVVRKPRELFAGILFLAVAIFVFVVARHYTFGTSRQMGPGYFPIILSLLNTGFALMLIVRSFFGKAESFGDLSVRPAVFILAGTLSFGLLIKPAGLIVAVVTTVLLGSYGSVEFKPLPAIASAVVLAAGSAVVFVLLLGQPLPILGYWFR